ncbi:MAG TPA: hypothetical protein VJ208_01670 [Candidatus Nanoarchaeia archaeon]|nr:hypothetical protein [Candidatus Nanoarchaeia archaeon]
MEQMNLQKIGKELASLRQAVEEISEAILEDRLEVSDEVIGEIEKSRKKPESSFVSQEDVEAEFLK